MSLPEEQPPAPAAKRDEDGKLLWRYRSPAQKIISFCLFAAVVFSAWHADYDHIRSRLEARISADALLSDDEKASDASARYALDHPEEWLKGSFATKLQNALALSFNFIEGDSDSFTDARVHYTDEGWDDFVSLARKAGLVRLNTPRTTERFSFLKGPAHYQQFSNGMPISGSAVYRFVFEGVGTTPAAKLTYFCNAELLRDTAPGTPPKTVQINRLRCEIAGLPK